ncbi:CAF1-domain-containing protein [Clavulina sp. PMI_390]|nr:CAF1-domain-containing protein [Clavulina sp. PMI_390]
MAQQQQRPPSPPSPIREVWATNLEQEFAIIRRTIDDFPYISMDTEFPGVVARPIGNFTSSPDYMYQTMRCNVDLLNVIQLGLTLSDIHGNRPPDICTWQFNFYFNENEDMFAPDSYELLQKSGIDFPRHAEFGIKSNDFAELMITSGLVLTPDTRWITYSSGYDFGYFLKVLTAAPLPGNEDEFMKILTLWFPRILDTKVICRVMDKNLRGGLKELAELLGVPRIGQQHQAGSDSLITGSVFFRLRDTYFPSEFDESSFRGQIYGFGTSPSQGFGTGVGGASQSSAMYQNQNSTPSFTPAPSALQTNHNPYPMRIPITNPNA